MNLIIENWSQRMLSATLQGAVALGVVLLLVSYIPALPPLAKVWALRIGMLKLLFSALVIAGVGVTTTRPGAPGATGVSLFASVTATLLPIAFFLWLTSCAAAAYRYLRSSKRLAEIVADAEQVTDLRTIEVYRLMCRRMAIKNSPALKTHDSISSPLLIQNGVASIILPVNLVGTPDSFTMEAAIAHELAHHKHGDLRWGWLSAICDLFFFFHPLVNPAIKKLRLAEECAADAAAMRATNSNPSAYSRTLLSFAETSLSLSGVYAMADSAKDLDKRIKTIYGQKRNRTATAAAFTLLLCASLTLCPWTIEAKSQKQEQVAQRVFSPSAIAAPMFLAK